LEIDLLAKGMIEYNILNINFTKFGQTDIKWRKYFFLQVWSKVSFSQNSREKRNYLIIYLFIFLLLLL